MTSHNVALWDINIALWAVFLFIVTRIFHLQKNDLFDVRDYVRIDIDLMLYHFGQPCDTVKSTESKTINRIYRYY